MATLVSVNRPVPKKETMTNFSYRARRKLASSYMSKEELKPSIMHYIGNVADQSPLPYNMDN